MQQCPKAHIYAVDLLPLQVTLPNLTFLRGNFMDPNVRSHLAGLIRHDVDIVLSDMMGACILLTQQIHQGMRFVMHKHHLTCAWLLLYVFLFFG